MTVKELIEKLKKYDEDTEVRIQLQELRWGCPTENYSIDSVCGEFEENKLYTNITSYI